MWGDDFRILCWMYYEFQNYKDFVSGNFRILGFQSLTSVNKAFQDGNDFQFANVENFREMLQVYTSTKLGKPKINTKRIKKVEISNFNLLCMELFLNFGLHNDAGWDSVLNKRSLKPEFLIPYFNWVFNFFFHFSPISAWKVPFICSNLISIRRSFQTCSQKTSLSFRVINSPFFFSDSSQKLNLHGFPKVRVMLQE